MFLMVKDFGIKMIMVATRSGRQPQMATTTIKMLLERFGLGLAMRKIRHGTLPRLSNRRKSQMLSPTMKERFGPLQSHGHWSSIET